MSRNTPNRGYRGGGRGGGRLDTPHEHQPSPSLGPRSTHGRGSSSTSSNVPPRQTPVPEPPRTAADQGLTEDLAKKLTVSPPKEGLSSAEVAEPSMPPASSKAMRHPPRPGYGTVGKPCVVKANHFLVQVAANDIHRYDIAISPETTKSVNRKIVSELVSVHGKGFLGDRIPAYDGMKSLYTAGALPFQSKEFVIKLPPLDGQEKKRDKEFKVTIKFAGHADVHHLMEFIQRRRIDAPKEAIQALDVVLRQSPLKNYVSVGRSFFSVEFGSMSDLGDGVECWRGFYQSLRPTQMGLSLNVDICSTSFYKPMPVVEFVAEFLGLREKTRPLSDSQRVKVKKVLRGLRVEVTHRGDLRRRYRISGLTNVPTSQLSFPCDEAGTLITVVQYFKQQYNVKLMNLQWPCLEVGNGTRANYLPMEVCKIVEGQRYAKKLNQRQVTGILRSTCQRPHEREKSIIDMVNYNNYNADKFAKEFGIKISNSEAKVDARVLPPPMLKYHDSGREKSCRPAVGQWNMINKRMFSGGVVENWACINFSSRLRGDDVNRFCNNLVQMCNQIGMDFNPRPFANFPPARLETLESSLKDVFNKSKAMLMPNGKSIQLLIIILPEMSGYYGRIKRICETELGIISQCCQPKHVANSNVQYLENVALKINVKTGGRNTVLEDALYKRIPMVTDLPTIILGADVTHPSPGEDSTPSIASVVGSMDWPYVTNYMALVSAQTSREEMIQNLFTVYDDPKRGKVAGGMIRELLLGFYRSTKQRPHRIIFYRDGVSEGQFSQVLLYEMDAIRKACASLQEDYQPRVTFVVVQKRHHTRLFPDVHGKRDSTDKSGNILPGTVVDKVICHPTEFDFYLCSHAGIKGTSRPTHYHVLWDENRFTADGLQVLTNNLCYTYARCTRAVSIVPPAYYAHLAAFRARYYMETDGSSDGGSSNFGRTSGSSQVRQLPAIADNVKQVMFFC